MFFSNHRVLWKTTVPLNGSPKARVPGARGPSERQLQGAAAPLAAWIWTVTGAAPLNKKGTPKETGFPLNGNHVPFFSFISFSFLCFPLLSFTFLYFPFTFFYSIFLSFPFFYFPLTFLPFPFLFLYLKKNWWSLFRGVGFLVAMSTYFSFLNSFENWGGPRVSGNFI